MDAEIEALRRACRESPDDAAAAVRLGAALERAGRPGEAWRALLGFLRALPTRVPRGEARDRLAEPAREAAAGLGRREPAATLAFLRERVAPFARDRDWQRFPSLLLADDPRREAVEDVATAIDVLGRARELPVLLVLGCGDDPAFLELVEGALDPHVERQLGRVAVPIWDLAMMVAGLGGVDTVALEGPAGEDDAGLAFAYLSAARAPGGVVLLPWVAALSDAPREAIASEARSVFHHWTGQDRPPVDVADLARRLAPRPGG